ncbi:MAG: NAD(P)-dependent oxidoreductase [Acidobacteriota bacterium]|nr:NAD(P)-dependent oxidoreductase [Acidobacteriota bacterium]
MTEPTRIGWIGCGRMGTAMATRLIAAGHSLTVTNRTLSKTDPLVALGASAVARPRDLGDCDVVFVMVSADRDLVEVVSGPDGVLADPARVPSTVIDCSTVSTETSAAVRADCAERGVAFLAAPVSGNPKVVASGQLTLAVSGPRRDYDAVADLFAPLGQGATYVGEGEAARLVKICHNVLLGVVTQALAEITVLAERGGVARSALLEFVNGSVMGSPFTRYKAPAFVNLDFRPTFTPVLLRKDFDLGLGAAHDHGVPMPVAALCRELVASAVGAGYQSEDFAVLLLEQARRAGLVMEPEDVEVDDGLGAP